MMKRLRWSCIWLLVSSPLFIVRGQLLTSPPYAMVKTDAPQNNNNGQWATDNGLPCQDSSPTCLQTLGELAVRHSRELAVLKEAITLQKKKRWTSWLHADGLHPLAIGLRIARNVAGGGDRAALQLDIARLELRRAEAETNLRQAVQQAVFNFAAARTEQAQARTNWTTMSQRVRWVETAYRWGESSTEAMLLLWQAETEAQARLQRAEQRVEIAQANLMHLVFPRRPTP